MKEAAIEILTHFDATAELYQRYLTEGQTYSIAKGLKMHNEHIIEALNSLANEFEQAPHDWSKALIAHLEEWRRCWVELDHSKDFQDHEPFVFQNNHRYPREKATQLENYLRKLAK